jgi:hypothetical protein
MLKKYERFKDVCEVPKHLEVLIQFKVPKYLLGSKTFVRFQNIFKALKHSKTFLGSKNFLTSEL